MNLFDRLVDQALQNQTGLGPLRVVVEKELLHHDILREMGNVNTWKLKVVTRPERKDLPSQKINIDICSIPSYDRRPMLLRNRYGVEMGSSGLILQAQSREEILADKIVAFALRPNRIKYRDLWDIAWLKQQNISLPLALIPKKAADHRRELDEFVDLLAERAEQICSIPIFHDEFLSEMSRFLPPDIVAKTVNKPDFWTYLTELIRTECNAVQHSIKHASAESGLRM